jgi:hypothetical protein
MKYTCLKCNKEFKQKGHYDYHTNRKRSCVVLYDVNINNTILTNNTIKNPHKTAQIPHKTAQTPHKTAQNYINNDVNKNEDNDNNIIHNNNLDQNNFECEFCNKLFTRKDTLIRHLNKYCKIKQDKEQDKMEIQYLLEQNKQIINELKETKEEINNLKKENKELKQSTQLCKVSKGKTTKKNLNLDNNYSQNTLNNSQNNNSINTLNNLQTNNSFNNTVNFDNKTLVNFGSEDVSIIAEDEILGAINTITDAYSSFVTVVHANEKHPQYSNLKIPNLRSNYGMMIEEGKFVTKTLTDILDELKNNRLPELINYVKMFHANGKLSKQRYNTIMKKLEFIQNTYIETEDVDGNIIKCDKTDLKKLKEYNFEIVKSVYDNTETINSNINQCKPKSNQLIQNV